MFKKKKASIKFVGRKHSIYGLISTIIGGIALIALGVLVFITTGSQGTTNVWIGLAGLFLLGLSLAGLITGCNGFKQKDIFYTLPIIGAVLNGLIFIGMVVLYFFGLSMMAA